MSATATGVLYGIGVTLVGFVVAWLWPALAELLALNDQDEQRVCRKATDEKIASSVLYPTDRRHR